jgi:hypothetical protein
MHELLAVGCDLCGESMVTNVSTLDLQVDEGPVRRGCRRRCRAAAVTNETQCRRSNNSPPLVSRSAPWASTARRCERYAGRAEAAGMAPGGAPLSQAQWAEKVHAWFPELTVPRARSSAFGRVAAFHECLKEHLPATTLATIHQRLRGRAWPHGEHRQPAPLRAQRAC